MTGSALPVLATFRDWCLLRADVVIVAIAVALMGSVAVKFVKLFQRKKQLERTFHAFGSPPPHWLFGHLLIHSGDEKSFRHQSNLATDYGTCYKLWIGPFTCMLTLTHPDAIKQLTATAEPKGDYLYDMVRPWLGDGLLLSGGKKWARNRRLLTPGFHFDILKPYVSIFRESAQIMLDKWADMEHSQSFDIQSHISLMTLDSLLKCIFSFESNCQTFKEDPYIKSVYLLAKLVQTRFGFLPYLSDTIFYNSYHGYKFKKACDFVHAKARHVIEERRQNLAAEQLQRTDEKQNKRKYLDFLDILLSTRDEDGKGLTDEEIRDEVDTFMFEGHDTTASGTSWILYNLARHPEYQERCRAEIDELMESKEEKVFEWDDLSKLPYTTMCIKESLRLHPPVPYIARRLTKPFVLPDGRSLPAGHMVGISVFCCHHNANVWPDPDVYDPERFSPENTKDRSPYAFIPFSAGPRNCIGQHFAMNELKVAVAMTIHRFRLSVDENKDVSRINQLVLRSKTGLHLYIKPREAL